MENDTSRSDRSRVRSGVILWRTMKAVGAQRIFIVYLVFQKQFIAGIATGSGK